MAIGGNWPGFSIDDKVLPSKMYVDYVRVYEDEISVNTKKVRAANNIINLYPNPTSNVLHFKLKDFPANMNYKITNALGLKVQQSTLSEKKIDIGKLSPGTRNLLN